MHTMHPVLKRGGLFWDRDLLPPRAYEERFARIQGAIAASGDDAWLIFGDVERYGALAWFSNFLPRTRSAIALVPARGAPSLLISVGLRDVPAAKTLTWIDDVRPFTRLPRTLTGLIEEKGLASARVGLACVEELLSIKDWSEIEAALPSARFVTRTAEVAALRASKDDCEFAALRQAAEVVSGGLDLCAGLLKPGVNLRVALSRVERHVRAHAAEDARIMQAAGRHASIALRPLEDHELREGEVVMVYLAAEVQRYWAEEARTFVLGAASANMRRLADRATAALDAMTDLAAAGVAVDQIARAADAALETDHLRLSACGYGYGSGIGLDAGEAPCITGESGDLLPARAALALRVVAHETGAGIALARTLHLRDDGKQVFGRPSLLELP